MAWKRMLHANEDRRFQRAAESVDYPFLILILMLLAVGLTMLYSASYAQSEYDTGYAISTKYLQKQGVCAAIGLVAMYFFSRIPAKVWFRLAWPLYGFSIVLLLSVLVVGQEVNGAKRWINLAGIQFQPSEVAKFTMIVLFARLTRLFGQDAKQFRCGVLGFGAALLGILVPLALEKHLSAIMLMGMVAVVMMFVAGTSPRWLLAGAGAAVVFVLIYISFMGYAGDRVTAWLHRSKTRVTPATRFCSPCMPSAPVDCSGWGLENPGRNISTCPSSTTTISSPSAARSWDWWGRWQLWRCSPSPFSGAIGSPFMLRTGFPRCLRRAL